MFASVAKQSKAKQSQIVLVPFKKKTALVKYSLKGLVVPAAFRQQMALWDNSKATVFPAAWRKPGKRRIQHTNLR